MNELNINSNFLSRRIPLLIRYIRSSYKWLNAKSFGDFEEFKNRVVFSATRDFVGENMKLSYEEYLLAIDELSEFTKKIIENDLIDEITEYYNKEMGLQENISRIKEVMGLITETRKGLMRYLTDVSQKITGIEWPEYVLRDWLYRNTKEVGDMNPEMYKDLMKSYLESFLEGHGKGHWEYKIIDISLDVFTKFVQDDLIKKIGGYINPHVPKDEERHKTQMSQLESGGISPEPIIVVETKDGKYDLLEGWHRTTNALKKYGHYKQNAWVYKLD